MKLELGNFYVKDIVFGDKTKYEDGILSVNKEECLAFVRRDPHITEADLRIVKPGDMVRLVPVKEAVESVSYTHLGWNKNRRKMEWRRNTGGLEICFIPFRL